MNMDTRLDELGDRLERSVAADLRTEQRTAGAPTARARRIRPRLLAGSTLGLAGVGAALVLALSGSAAPPAFAVTKHADGSVLVRQTSVEAVPEAESQLASATGTQEWYQPEIASGAAPATGPIRCTPAPASTSAAGQSLAGATPSGSTSATGGPPVSLLLGTDGTSSVPAGQTGAGPWHLVGCYLYSGPFPGTGNTGNSGNTGNG